MLRIQKLDYANECLSMGSLIEVELEDLLEEVTRLLVVEIAKVIRVKLIIVNLDVFHPLGNLSITDIFNALFIVIKDDCEQDILQVEDANHNE